MTSSSDPLFIPPTRTRTSIPVLFSALREAWIDELGEVPSSESLLVLLAQWGIETGDGKSCWNFNLGNVKRIQGQPWTWLSNVPEILSHVPADATRHVVLGAGKFKCYFDPPNAQTHFRAFATLEEGAPAFVRFLHDKYQSAWPAVVAGDFETFAIRIKAKHYYTADVGELSPEGMALAREILDAKGIAGAHGVGYASALRGRAAAFRKLLNAPPPPPAFNLRTPEGQAGALEQLGFTGETALTDFQRAQGISPTGPFGPRTTAAVHKLLAAR